jgi:hypothetical protein
MTQPCRTCFRDADGMLIIEPVGHPALLGETRIELACLHCADEALEPARMDDHHRYSFLAFPDR